MKITYLGPSRATFSAIAFYRMAATFGLQIAGAEEALVSRNEDIVPLVAKHGGYGAIAMDTKSTGRVDPPVNSFIGLLEDSPKGCPIGIIGALRMKINFALMVRPGVCLRGLEGVTGHPKAIGACRNKLAELGVSIVEADSNGKAAENVAQVSKFSRFGALAPAEAAVKYGLEVLDPAFEDEGAVTTFFLLGPRGHKMMMAPNQQRALLVFSVKHVPGALAKALMPFGDKMLNLIHVHSLFVGNGHYDFAAEFELGIDQTGDYGDALVAASEHMGRFIGFGPFPVL